MVVKINLKLLDTLVAEMLARSEQEALARRVQPSALEEALEYLHDEVAAWAEPLMRTDVDVAVAVEEMIAKETPDPDDVIIVEIPGRWSRTGNPITGAFRVPAVVIAARKQEN